MLSEARPHHPLCVFGNLWQFAQRLGCCLLHVGPPFAVTSPNLSLGNWAPDASAGPATVRVPAHARREDSATALEYENLSHECVRRPPALAPWQANSAPYLESPFTRHLKVCLCSTSVQRIQGLDPQLCVRQVSISCLSAIRIYMYTYNPIYIHIYRYTCIHIYIYIYIHIFLYIYMYMYIHVYLSTSSAN